MDSGFLNSLVGDYLSSVSSKLADKFKKETKATPLPPNSPSIAEMVNHFKETTPKVSKRKLAMTNGDSAAKKAKKVRILNTWWVSRFACICNTTWYNITSCGESSSQQLN